jgi:hypothetical protein
MQLQPIYKRRQGKNKQASNKQQATSNKQQATSNKQQATSNKQQATSNKQQATSNKQQAEYRPTGQVDEGIGQKTSRHERRGCAQERRCRFRLANRDCAFE